MPGNPSSRGNLHLALQLIKKFIWMKKFFFNRMLVNRKGLYEYFFWSVRTIPFCGLAYGDPSAGFGIHEIILKRFSGYHFSRSFISYSIVHCYIVHKSITNNLLKKCCYELAIASLIWLIAHVWRAALVQGEATDNVATLAVSAALQVYCTAL